MVFDEDRQWYAKHKDELLPLYRNQFVAILEGKVVDSDPDFDELARRVYGKYGYRDLFMPRVKEGDAPFRMPSPKIKRGPG